MKVPIELKINYKTELKAFTDLIVVSLLWIPASMIFVFILPSFVPFLAMIGSYLILFFIPVIVLHTNYELENKNKILILGQGIVKYGELKITENEIKKITAIGTGKSLNLENFARLAHMSGYYYLEIETYNGEKIFVTSLFSDKLLFYFELSFPNIRIKKQEEFYPIIKNCG